MRVLPLGGSARAIGALVAGACPSQQLGPQRSTELRQQLLQHSVLVFRAVATSAAGCPPPPLSEDALVEFFRHFGEALPQQGREEARGSRPEIFTVTNMLPGAPSTSPFLSDAELEWHSDLSYRREPGEFSCLHAKILPGGCGSVTLFADTAAAYRTIPVAMTDRLADAMAIHRHPEAHMNTEGEVAMPVVRTHPETGQPAIFVSPMFTDRILGMSCEESQSTLEYLFEHMAAERFVYRHEWKVGDTVLWDNRQTMHRRLPFSGNRLLWRTQSRSSLV
jgi:taurine dioxygenase